MLPRGIALCGLQKHVEHCRSFAESKKVQVWVSGHMVFANVTRTRSMKQSEFEYVRIYLFMVLGWKPGP